MGNCCNKKKDRYDESVSKPKYPKISEFQLLEMRGSAFSSLLFHHSAIRYPTLLGLEYGTLLVADPGEGTCVRKFQGHSDDVLCLARVSHQLASASRDGSLRIWDLAKEEPEVHIQAHASAVVGLCSVPGSPSVLVTGARDATVSFWDAATSTCLGTENIGQNTVTAMKMLNETTVLQTAEDLCLRIWDARTYQVTSVLGKGALQYFPTCVDVAGDGLHAVTGHNGFDGSGCTVCEWDVRNASAPVRTLCGHLQKVTCVAFPSGAHDSILSGSKDQTMRFWNVAEAAEKHQVIFADDSLTSFSCDLESGMISSTFFSGDAWLSEWRGLSQIDAGDEPLRTRSKLHPFS
eukprot:ANDGO_05285.mRNA.1 putative serine/threonine-protein kinase PkwA